MGKMQEIMDRIVGTTPNIYKGNDIFLMLRNLAKCNY